MKTTKQIKYWINSAKDDIDTAELLIEKNKLLHGLFFCHLSVEKSLRAIFVKSNENIPPRTHNLLFLIDKIPLNLDEDKEEFLGVLMKFQLEGRYPDYNPDIPTTEKSNEYLEKTKELPKWIENQL